MTTTRFTVLSAALLTLGACAAPPATTGGGLVPHGLVEITFSGVGSAEVRATAHTPSAPLHAQGLTDSQGGLQLQPLGAATLQVGTSRYLSASVLVRNADQNGQAYAAPSSDLAFFAVDVPGTLAGSAVSGLTRFDGSDYADAPVLRKTLARAVVPAQAMTLSGGALTALPGAADFVAFTEAEVNPANFTPPTTLANLGLRGLLPYAYAVRCVTNCALGPRTLAANPAAQQFDGEVTFAVKLPVQGRAADNPVRFSLLFEVLGGVPGRVTIGPDEGLDLLAPAERALASGVGAVLAIGSGQHTLSASEDASLRANPAYHTLSYQGVANLRTADPDPQPAPGDPSSFGQIATLLPEPQSPPTFALPPVP